MGWVWAFWGLAALVVAMVALDIVAMRRGAAGRLPAVSLGLKGLVALGFGAWWLYFGVLSGAQTWEDLATFAGLIVLSVPVLLVAVVLDVLIVRALGRPRP